MTDSIKLIKANQVLDLCDNDIKLAIKHIDRLLSSVAITNIKRIDFLLDIRNIINIIA